MLCYTMCCVYFYCTWCNRNGKKNNCWYNSGLGGAGMRRGERKDLFPITVKSLQFKKQSHTRLTNVHLAFLNVYKLFSFFLLRYLIKGKVLDSLLEKLFLSFCSLSHFIFHFSPLRILFAYFETLSALSVVALCPPRAFPYFICFCFLLPPLFL